MTDGEQAILSMIMQLNNTVLSLKKFLVEESKKRPAMTFGPDQEIRVRTQESHSP